MAETETKVPETNPNEELKNDATTASTQPQGNASEDAEVERLRKEAEQAKMRANQLANELKAKAEAEEEAKRKAAEENEEFKSLYEQAQAKAESLQKEQEERERAQELERETTSLFGEFSDEVVEIAKEAGLSLTDVTDEAKEALKSKLTKLSEKVSSNSTPGANNPPPAQRKSKEEFLQEYATTGNKAAFDAAISELGWIKANRSSQDS